VRGEIQPHFGAGNEGHRDAIRRHLAENLSLVDPAVTDLSAPPDVSTWSISISHTTDLGGWLAVNKPRQIGFDLEVRARVREAVVRRMCTPDEIERVSDLALLWSAKEALFKAMARGQPATLSQLRIVEWTVRGALAHFLSDGGQRGIAQASAQHAAAWCLI
jgi:4'-phosphopantetheinyl transferase EntD